MLGRLPWLRLGAAAAAVGGYVGTEYQAYLALRADAAVEAHLPEPDVARSTQVVRIPRLLTDEEIASVHELYARRAGELGSAGRNAANQAAAYHTGVWETSYLNTDGTFATELPELRAKLIAAATAVDDRHWGLLRSVSHPVTPRCVEYHRVSPSGSLPFQGHHDAGSLLTIDVLLSTSAADFDRGDSVTAADFEGGKFVTAEDGGRRATHAFGRGDALVFVSHKPHSVMPVTRGERRVLVMELWEGEERTCGHRCERHWGPCGHTARASFWRRAMQDMASDL